MSDRIDDFDDDLTVPATPVRPPSTPQPVDDFSDDATIAFTPRPENPNPAQQPPAAPSDVWPTQMPASDSAQTTPSPFPRPVIPEPGSVPASESPRVAPASPPAEQRPAVQAQAASPNEAFRPSPAAGQMWTPPRRPTAPSQLADQQPGRAVLMAAAGVAALLLVAIVVWLLILRGDGDTSQGTNALTMLRGAA